MLAEAHYPVRNLRAPSTRYAGKSVPYQSDNPHEGIVG